MIVLYSVANVASDLIMMNENKPIRDGLFKAASYDAKLEILEASNPLIRERSDKLKGDTNGTLRSQDADK